MLKKLHKTCNLAEFQPFLSLLNAVVLPQTYLQHASLENIARIKSLWPFSLVPDLSRLVTSDHQQITNLFIVIIM